ncbi:hypothetical protein SDC9_24664 [bioreactor metagenome]|uniref:Histidine kinase domain-containing protein n=1 Tax=bioreactor metagenome TaxID=1076179 RepID=A0A644UIP2_9ZZZZ|nr:ATP-binding protein [Desulfitobacterium hafniense]MEA5025955.1 ATP-binding protein [Desulfitobacterium hafniense]
MNIAEVDFHIIMNNFFLNSSWFLEKAKGERREITITVSDESGKIILLLENNGPPLDSIFENNPDRIFEAGVSTKNINKNEGTGLGLWITKTIVDNNSGEIHPIRTEEGFGLRITLLK